MTRYRLVAEHRAQLGVEEMCRVLKVYRSDYYDWQPSDTSDNSRGSAAGISTGSTDLEPLSFSQVVGTTETPQAKPLGPAETP